MRKCRDREPGARTELVVERSGTFYAYGDRFRHTCFGRLGGSTPFKVGSQIWSVLGEFLEPPVPHGALQLLKSSYPWGLTGGSAVEAASLSLKTHLPVREQTTVAASPVDRRGSPSRHPSAFPRAPRRRRSNSATSFEFTRGEDFRVEVYFGWDLP